MYSFDLWDKKVEPNAINEFKKDSAGNYKKPTILSDIVLNNNRVSLCKSNAGSSINNPKSSLKKSFDDAKLATTLSSIEKANIDKLFSLDEDDFSMNESSTQLWVHHSKNHQDMIENRPPKTVKEISSLPTQNIVQSHQSSATSESFKHYHPVNRGIQLGSRCFEKGYNNFEKSLVNVTDSCFSISDTNSISQIHEEQLDDDVEETEDSVIVISSDDSMDSIDSLKIFDNKQGISERVNNNFSLDNLSSFPLKYEGEEYIKEELKLPISTYNINSSKPSPFHRNMSFSDCFNSIKFIKDETTDDFYIKDEAPTWFSTPEYFQEPQNHLIIKNDSPISIQSGPLVSDTHENYLSTLAEKRPCEFSNKIFKLNESKVKSEIDTLETIINKAAIGSTKSLKSKRPSMLRTFKRLHPTKMLSNYSCEYSHAFLRKDLQPIIYIELD